MILVSFYSSHSRLWVFLIAWLFGLLAATIITLSSLSGLALIPVTRHKHYKVVLMFLISVAIGTLNGTAFLHLIPQVFFYLLTEFDLIKKINFLKFKKAFGISDDDRYAAHHAYVWKAMVILSGSIHKIQI